jgi:hypothetical protein
MSESNNTNLNILMDTTIYKEYDFRGWIYSFYNSHLYIGAILLILNLIERRVLEIMLLMDLQIYKNQIKSTADVNTDPVGNFKENENLTLGLLIRKLETGFCFEGKSDLIKQLKGVNKIRVDYIHNLVENPRSVQMGNRKSNKDYKILNKILDNLGSYVNKINNGWIGKNGKLLKTKLLSLR